MWGERGLQEIHSIPDAVTFFSPYRGPLSNDHYGPSFASTSAYWDSYAEAMIQQRFEDINKQHVASRECLRRCSSNSVCPADLLVLWWRQLIDFSNCLSTSFVHFIPFSQLPHFLSQCVVTQTQSV